MCRPQRPCQGSCLFSSPGLAARWPLAGTLTVSVGGVRASCEAALAACEILESSRASAIRSLLRARGNPLADCDYHSVYLPGMARARLELAEKKGCIGPKGRHLAKHVFCQAVRQAVAQAACQALSAALGEVASDDRYAAAIARDGAALARARRPQAA